MPHGIIYQSTLVGSVVQSKYICWYDIIKTEENKTLIYRLLNNNINAIENTYTNSYRNLL